MFNNDGLSTWNSINDSRFILISEYCENYRDILLTPLLDRDTLPRYEGSPACERLG